MSLANNSNPSRVTRIVEALELIEKSAASNRSDMTEIAGLLNPVFAKLGDLGFVAGAYGPDTSGGHVSPPAVSLTAGERAALALADKASLRDLIAALIGRLEAHAAKMDS